MRYRLFFYSSIIEKDMKKVFLQIRKHWLTNLVTLVVSLVVGAVIFCLMFFLRNMTLISAVDGIALATAVVILFGLLMLVNHLGAFDTFAFGFKQLGTMIFAKDARKEGPYHEYKENMAIKRQDSSYNFVIVIFVGLLFAIALVVLEIVYHSYI